MEVRISFEGKNKATASDLVEPGKIAGRAGIEKHYVISTTPVDLQGMIYPWILYDSFISLKDFRKKRVMHYRSKFPDSSFINIGSSC